MPPHNGLVIPRDVAKGQARDRLPIYQAVFHYRLCRLLLAAIHEKVYLYVPSLLQDTDTRVLLSLYKAYLFSAQELQGFTLELVLTVRHKRFIFLIIFIFNGNSIAASKAF